MRFLLLFLFLFAFNPFQAQAQIETTEVIAEFTVKGGEKGVFELKQNVVTKTLQEGLIEAARKLSNDKLNAKILEHYHSVQDPLKMGYVHGYNIVTKDYDINSGLYNVVLKILYFSTPIRKDLTSFGLHPSVSNSNEDKDATFLVSVRLIENSAEKVIHLSDIITEVFELKGTSGSLLVKGDTTFLEEQDLHKKYPTKWIVMVNLSFSKTENSPEIRGILSYKVIDKSNEILKAMSFTENVGITQEDRTDEPIYILTRNLIQRMLRSYSEKN